MRIIPGNSYTTLSGHNVSMQGKIDIESLITYHKMNLIKVIGLQSFNPERFLDIINNSQIIWGLTSNLDMPCGYWKENNGKCIGGNLSGELENIKFFDIRI